MNAREVEPMFVCDCVGCPAGKQPSLLMKRIDELEKERDDFRSGAKVEADAADEARKKLAEAMLRIHDLEAKSDLRDTL